MDCSALRDIVTAPPNHLSTQHVLMLPISTCMMHRGEFTFAVEHLQRAVQRLTSLNPNPYDGEALYTLGITLRMLGRDDEAYSVLYKATWNYAWQAASFVQLAQVDCRRQVCELAVC